MFYKQEVITFCTNKIVFKYAYTDYLKPQILV